MDLFKISYIRRLKFLSDDSRSSVVKKNALASFLIKGIDGVVYMLIVPATLGFIDKYSYGVWLTIGSVFAWINSFDMGLGNGLRNCLTRSLALKNVQESRIYISTTYCLLTLITGAIICLFSVVCPYLDWYELLNVDYNIVPDLEETIVLSFSFLCISFVLKIIGTIYLSMQMQAVDSLMKALSYILSLLLIVSAKHFLPNGTLLIAAIIFSISPCLVYLFATLYSFSYRLRDLVPSLRYIQLKTHARQLLGMGLGFFLINISVLLMNLLTNFLISNRFGPAQVTPYSIANRYMAICILAYGIILAPLWSAITDAQAKGDMKWIANTMKKIRLIVLSLGCLLATLVVLSPLVYSVWIGNQVEIPVIITLLNAIYVFVLIWSASQATFLCGMNILRVQLIMNILQVLIFLPVALSLSSVFGIYGLIVGLILSNLPVAVTNTIQVSMLLNGHASGIWKK